MPNAPGNERADDRQYAHDEADGRQYAHVDRDPAFLRLDVLLPHHLDTADVTRWPNHVVAHEQVNIQIARHRERHERADPTLAADNGGRVAFEAAAAALAAERAAAWVAGRAAAWAAGRAPSSVAAALETERAAAWAAGRAAERAAAKASRAAEKEALAAQKRDAYIRGIQRALERARNYEWAA